MATKMNIIRLAFKILVHENVNYEKNHRENAEKDNSTSYDYDYLVKEYYNEDNGVIETDPNPIYQDMDKVYAKNNNSAKKSSKEKKIISWKSISHSFYSSRRQNMIQRSLWKIMKVLFVIYLLVAVPLWCTRGWCCCCLFCKFFKSTQTIEEAKRFLDANPPGVLQDKKGGVVFYEATRNEKECYEKFGHLIRTI